MASHKLRQAFHVGYCYSYDLKSCAIYGFRVTGLSNSDILQFPMKFVLFPCAQTTTHAPTRTAFKSSRFSSVRHDHWSASATRLEHGPSCMHPNWRSEEIHERQRKHQLSVLQWGMYRALTITIYFCACTFARISHASSLSCYKLSEPESLLFDLEQNWKISS